MKTRILAVSISLLALAGCAGYERLPGQPIDGDYTVSGIQWTSGDITLILFKAFPDGGRLALCGAYTGRSAGDLDSRANRQMFDTANIYIGGERIGPMAFMQPVHPATVHVTMKGDEPVVAGARSDASCVRTDRPWQDRYAAQAITWEGPTRIVVVD